VWVGMSRKSEREVGSTASRSADQIRERSRGRSENRLEKRAEPEVVAQSVGTESRSLRETSVRELAGDLRLPRDVILGDALISFVGRNGVTVENYRGILLYERELVKLSARNCRIVIRGKNLRIDYYTNEQMHISGQIRCMEFEG